MALTYQWTIVSVTGGPTPTLNNATTLTTNFTYSTAGATIVLRLAITDTATGFSDSDEVAIRTIAPATTTPVSWIDGLMTTPPPAGTVNTELEVTIKDVAASGEQHYVGRDGWYVGFVPSEHWSPGGTADVDQLITLERRVVPPGDDAAEPMYEPMRHALRRTPDDSGGVTEYDPEVPARTLVEYVATASLPGTGGIPISVTAQSDPVRVSLPLETWFLSDVENPEVSVPIKAQSFSYSRSHSGEVIVLPGHQYPATTRIGPESRSGRRGELNLWVVDGFNRPDLDALLDAGHVMLLRDAVGKLFVYVAVLDEESWSRLRSPDDQFPRFLGDFYEAGIPFVEVGRPPVTL